MSTKIQTATDTLRAESRPENLARLCFYRVTQYHRDLRDMEGAPKYHEWRDALESALVAELVSLFQSIQPLVQEQNRILKEQWAEHLKICTHSSYMAPFIAEDFND